MDIGLPAEQHHRERLNRCVQTFVGFPFVCDCSHPRWAFISSSGLGEMSQHLSAFRKQFENGED
jgi:hypothetical protein